MRTPYDGIRKDGRLSHGGDASKAYDVFLSYKSEDVGVVRRVAEQLLANGLRVWFAEYLVLISSRERFQDVIDEGIRRSTYAVVFSNDRYIQSEHCLRELTQILDTSVVDRDNVLNIELLRDGMPCELYPQLEGIKSMACDGNVIGIMKFIQANTTLDIGSIGPESGKDESAPNEFVCEQASYRLDVAGWEMADPRGTIRGTEMKGPIFRRVINGHEWSWGVQIGPATTPSRSVPTGTIDDRLFFNDAIGFARRHLGGFALKARGVHLILVNGLSHLALTNWFFTGWMRKYSIIFPIQGTHSNIEFHFSCLCPGTFEEFCRHVRLVDDVVESLKFPLRQ